MSAQLAANAPPARTRTNLYGVAGDSQSWGVNQDSPLVTPLPFISWPALPTLMDRMHRTAVLAVSYVHVARVLCTVCVLYCVYGTGTRFVSAWCRVRVCVRYNIPTFYYT